MTNEQLKILLQLILEKALDLQIAVMEHTVTQERVLELTVVEENAASFIINGEHRQWLPVGEFLSVSAVENFCDDLRGMINQL